VIPIENYFKVETGTVFILGNGPSLNNFDLSKLDRDRVMTMNRSWTEVPGARYHLNIGDITSVQKQPQTMIYFGSEDSVGPATMKKVKAPVVLVQTTNAARAYPIKKKKQLKIPPALDLRNGHPTNSQAGLLALKCAWFLGYDTGVLLGYDGHGLHYTETHIKNPEPHLIPNHKAYVGNYRELARQLVGRMRVYNCNKENSYKVHPYINYDEALEAFHV
jgi:hypothetical protein